MRGERTRVLRLIARLNVGGPALHVSSLTRGLDEYGYETTLVAGAVGEGEGAMDYAATELGVSPVYLRSLRREVSPASDWESVRETLRLIREIRPHVLHTHTAKAGAIGRLAARLAGRDRPPVCVHTFHGHVLRGYFDNRMTAVYRTIERGLAPTTDGLVAVSPEVRDDLVDFGVAAAKDIAVIRLGLDLAARTVARPGAREHFRRSLSVPDDRFVIGWLGRMTDIKRAHDLVDAVAAARRAGADADLVLVGDGPSRATLADRLERELGPHGHLLGFVKDVGDVYAGVDAVALSSANEGTPVTLIEALAAGRPVLSTAVGGVPDVVRDGIDGFLSPAGDIGALANSVGRLAADPQRARAMGAGASERVIERYAVDRLVADIDALYRSLLEQKDGTRRRRVGSVARPLPPALERVPSPPRRSRAPLRIILVSQYFPPEVGATQSRIQSFADHLAAQGHDVTVICEFPNHPHGVVPPEYRGRLVVDDRSNAYRVLRVAVRANPEKTQRTRMEFYLSFMAMATLVSPHALRPDVIVASSPPLFTAVAGLTISRRTGAPLVLDVRDLWPAAAVSLGQLSNPHALRASELIERRLYRDAAAVIAVTAPFCRHIDGVRGRPPATSLIPNGTLERFFASESGDARRMLGVPDDVPLATFAGNLGIAQALPAVVDAAGQVRDSGIHVAFVGDGPLRDDLGRRADEVGARNVHFHPQVPLEEIPRFLAASDVLLVTLSGHPTFRDFVPSKMLDSMAAGKPVVLAAAGEAARILEAADAGIVVPPEDPVALAHALRALAGDPAEAARLGRNGARYARSRLRSVQAERLEEILVEVSRYR